MIHLTIKRKKKVIEQEVEEVTKAEKTAPKSKKKEE